MWINSLVEIWNGWSFSALQRAEIAEIAADPVAALAAQIVSVLFNEPKLLKCYAVLTVSDLLLGFSALQRAEIAEIRLFRRVSCHK